MLEYKQFLNNNHHHHMHKYSDRESQNCRITRGGRDLCRLSSPSRAKAGSQSLRILLQFARVETGNRKGKNVQRNLAVKTNSNYKHQY